MVSNNTIQGQGTQGTNFPGHDAAEWMLRKVLVATGAFTDGKLDLDWNALGIQAPSSTVTNIDQAVNMVISQLYPQFVSQAKAAA